MEIFYQQISRICSKEVSSWFLTGATHGQLQTVVCLFFVLTFFCYYFDFGEKTLKTIIITQDNVYV